MFNAFFTEMIVTPRKLLQLQPDFAE